MGYAPVLLDLTVPREHLVVKAGQVINGLCVSSVPRGLPYYLKLGNNPYTGPWLGIVTWTFGSAVPLRDVSEGVWVRVDFPAPSQSMACQVSFL